VSGYLTASRVLHPAARRRPAPSEDSRSNGAGCRAFLGA
jgi:hypothetical protein